MSKLLREYIQILLNERKTKDFNELITGYSGCWIHFSDLTKLGLNPTSTFKSPIGIYGYPLDGPEVRQQLKNNDLPFAADRKYIHVFKPRNIEKILRIDQISSLEEAQKLYQKIVPNSNRLLTNLVKMILKVMTR